MKKTVYLKKAGVYAAFLLPVFVCGIAGGDTFFNIAVSLVAVTYLLMLNDGMRAAYLLCAVYAVSYAAVGFASALYATAVFHACVLLPTAVFRFVVSGKKQIGADIRRLKIKGWTAALSCCALLACALYFLLKRIGDAQPFLDGLILAVSVVTSILMLKNYLEMWWFNLFSSSCGLCSLFPSGKDWRSRGCRRWFLSSISAASLNGFKRIEKIMRRQRVGRRAWIY